MQQTSRTRRKPPIGVFLATTIVLFGLTLSAAHSIGFVPCYIDDTCTSTSQSLSSGDEMRDESSVSLGNLPQPGRGSPAQDQNENTTIALPQRIVIPKIDLDLPVQNIKSRDIDTLYDHLKDGPIRYVDSARLGQNGNVLIFGHSSTLPFVRNPMYKAFNRVSELAQGDVITVSGEGRNDLYTVVSVESMDINDPRAVVDLSPERGRRLTLVTCDTLTGKSARFVLTADFIGTI